MIGDLDDLPMPGYHLVEGNLDSYHFKMMAGRKRYVIVEGSRGCEHNCSFCSQCAFWGHRWRTKSGKRIADEMESCRDRYGAEFIWLTDDNFTFGPRSRELIGELKRRRLGDEVFWFVQARVDDVVKNPEMIPDLRSAGCRWVLLGVESGDPETLASMRKGIDPSQAGKAIRLLEKNDIFAQATMIVGHRRDTHESIEGLRRYIDALNPGIAIFMILTPYPGTSLYEEALRNNWIEDKNWAHYDMIHAVMPTETLSRSQVQEELTECYRSFYGKLSRRLEGFFSGNRFKRRTYRYMASQNIVNGLRDLI
jgi:anaerobic magnesium-protoporphyrin IX monomethyl ester cyclase